MDQEIRNKLRNVVTQCRELLEDSVSQELEGKYTIFAKDGKVTADPNAEMKNLTTEEDRSARKDILDHFAHIKARGFKPKEALDQLVREIAFTHLNRLCAYKMMEAREVYVGEQKFREAVSRGVNSNGVKFYLADHPEEERLYNTGHQDVAYRHFLDWLGGLLSDEIGVLFNPNDPANRLYPRQKTLDEVLDLLNGGGIKAEETELRDEWPLIWSQDETIGWVYQYFTPKELRDQARKESAAPRNSYELAFRNQFFTPRYVVEFLTDNTLGRIWYEMRKGDTKLKDQCRYMVRRPNEIFLKEGQQPPKDAAESRDDLSQEELLKLPIHIPHRPKKDPRELKILDPASGSGHFPLYCFDLLLTIYEEAYADPDLGPALQKDYQQNVENFRREVPRLILAHNLYGVDIDLRCTQIAALALWLRCQRAYQEMGLKKDRPKITRSNFVCAEPMPGEEQMLKEFVSQLEPKVLGQVVAVVFEKMKLAGEAGSLLKIEEEIRDAVAAAKKQWVRESRQATDRKGQPLLFTQAAMDRLAGKPEQTSIFDLSDITDDQFFERAEAKVIEALRQYAEKAQNGQWLQRRLFTEDTERGFAFVDLCQKRYDVVLMNPPFGGLTPVSKKYLSEIFSATWNDIYACFIERTLQLLRHSGRLGCITSSTYFNLISFRKLRDILLDNAHPQLLADLGAGVMDDAAVSAAAAVIDNTKECVSLPLTFLDLRHSSGNEHNLIASIGILNEGLKSPSLYVRPPRFFKKLPNSILAYWTTDRVHEAFLQNRPLGAMSEISFGLHARGNDDQVYRAWWEPKASPNFLSEWPSVKLGGDPSRFVRNSEYVVNWQRDGALLREIASHAQGGCLTGSERYFEEGLTYIYTGNTFSVQPLEGQAIFTAAAHGLFPKEQSRLALLAFLNSEVCRLFLKTINPDRFFQAGYVRLLPIPQLCNESRVALEAIATECLKIKISHLVGDECCRWFAVEWTSNPENRGAEARLLNGVKESYVARMEQYAAALVRLNKMCLAAYGLDSEDIDPIADRTVSPSAPNLGSDLGSPVVNQKEFVSSAVSFCLGTAFGRWDIQFATGEKPATKLPNPFAPLPVCPPGQVQNEQGLPITEEEVGRLKAKGRWSYPIEIPWDGILVDEIEHHDDIIGGIRHSLEIIWKEQAEAIENEACEILGVKELRDYFRKLGKGGFWDDHISRYSKNRRKAPIYWLLQSSKKNYALWLYYHRLDKDLLFKVLVNYVEPKIRLETSRLETLRSQKAAAGESGKEAKRLAKEVERQEDFISELRDFEDKLRRAANLHLEPDLNDGVVLNIAPLHELVPWKEAKNYWEELLEGNYEWSSVGKQLQERGLVK